MRYTNHLLACLVTYFTSCVAYTDGRRDATLSCTACLPDIPRSAIIRKSMKLLQQAGMT